MTSLNDQTMSEHQKAIHDSAELFFKLRKKVVNGNLRSSSQIWDDVNELLGRLDELKTQREVRISDGVIAQVNERLAALPAQTDTKAARDQFLGVLNEVLGSDSNSPVSTQ